MLDKCIESIACQDGQLLNIEYHQKRLNNTLKHYYSSLKVHNLGKITVPNDKKNGLFKCRIIYDPFGFEVEFIPYIKKPIRRVALVYVNKLKYDFKFKNRDALNTLYHDAKNNIIDTSIDDILIIQNTLITDMLYSNVVFRRGDQWFTPRQPLLKGTFREYLLDKKHVIPIDIGVTKTSNPTIDFELNDFETFKPINALLRWDFGELNINQITGFNL